LCAVVVLSWTAIGTPRPAETTALMEHLASKIDRASALHPDTAQQLENLMDMPQYDCARVHCNAELQDRNEAARARLKQAIGNKRHPAAVVTAGHAHD
jgi:hypothetical protein